MSGLLTCEKCGASMAVYGWARKAGRTYRSFACAANRTRGPSICDNARSIGEAKVVQAMAETIRVTAADFLPEFLAAFQAEWKSELANREAVSPTADLDMEIVRQAARVDRLAAAVADAPDISPLLVQLRDANARLGGLRSQRAKVAPMRPAPRMPSSDQIRGYFDDLVSTLEADPAAARDVLAAAFTSVRLVPTATAYRLELTMAEVWPKVQPTPGGRAEVVSMRSRRVRGAGASSRRGRRMTMRQNTLVEARPLPNQRAKETQPFGTDIRSGRATRRGKNRWKG